MKQADLSDHGRSRGDVAQTEHTWDKSTGGCWRLHSYFVFLFLCRASAAVAMGKLVLVSGQHNHQAGILKPRCRGFAIPVTLLQFSDSRVTPIA